MNPRTCLSTLLVTMLLVAVPASAAEEETAASGRSLFLQHCSRCHGVDGKGGEGPSLAGARLTNAETDEQLAEVIRGGIPRGGMPGMRHLIQADVDALIVHVRSLGQVSAEPVPGDPAAGESLYWDWGCEACHVLGGIGVQIGPELTRIGLQRGPAHLRESLLEPGAKLPDGYEFLRAHPSGAAAVEGLLLNEDAFSIQLRDASGRFHSFDKADLERLDRFPKRSIMRTYRGRLTASEIDNLVAFLASQRGESEVALAADGVDR